MAEARRNKKEELAARKERQIGDHVARMRRGEEHKKGGSNGSSSSTLEDEMLWH